MQGFERIVAPFDGVITQRNVERGDLISTGSSGASKPLFSIAQSGTLRIQVDVPQSEAVNIQDGQKAALDVTAREYYVSRISAAQRGGHENVTRVDVALTYRIRGQHGISIGRDAQDIVATFPTLLPDAHVDRRLVE